MAKRSRFLVAREIKQIRWHIFSCVETLCLTLFVCLSVLPQSKFRHCGLAIVIDSDSNHECDPDPNPYLNHYPNPSPNPYLNRYPYSNSNPNPNPIPYPNPNPNHDS